MNLTTNINENFENNICVKCGMCCDGTLFNWANIEPDEILDELFREEIIKTNQKGKIAFSLPCSYLNGCVCSIYNSEKPKRPLVCGKFKCKLLLKQQAGTVSYDEAILLIEKTKQLAQKNDALISDALPKSAALSTSKKIKALKNEFESAPNQAEFRKQYGPVLLNSFAFETWLKKHFINQPKKNKA